MKKTLFFFAGIFLVGAFVSAQAPLVIDYSYDTSGRGTAATNYVTYTGPQRLATGTKDTYDATTGASKQRTTALFTSAYQLDIAQRITFPDAVRGLLLYPVSDDSFRTDDNLTVTQANGVITIQYAHRGTAYRVTTDRTGKVQFPKGTYETKVIGYIQGAGPQVISTDYTDGRATTANRIDWTKVWNKADKGGKTVPGSTAQTTTIIDNWPVSTIFHFRGELQFALTGTILTIKGSLAPVQGPAR
jgi:hypothetical protein